MKQQKINQGRKFNQVREGAKRIFLRDGYEGASVDDISREAGVSKATLYSYFPDKRLMFQAVIEAEIESRRIAVFDLEDHVPAHLAVPRLTREVSRILASETEAALYRLIIAEAARFPQLARDFEALRAEMLRTPLQAYLDGFVRRGELEIADTTLAAEQLIRLAGAQVHDGRLLGAKGIDDTAVLRAGDGAAEMFLRAFAPVENSSSGRAAAQ